MNLPMRQKYVDEAVGLFIVFGTHINGTVDVSDGQRDVFSCLPPAAAHAVCEAQNEFRQKLYKILCESQEPV